MTTWGDTLKQLGLAGSVAGFMLGLCYSASAAETTYQQTTLNYWRGAKRTPDDVVRADGTGGETLLGTDALPIRKAAGQ